MLFVVVNILGYIEEDLLSCYLAQKQHRRGLQWDELGAGVEGKKWSTAAVSAGAGWGSSVWKPALTTRRYHTPEWLLCWW